MQHRFRTFAIFIVLFLLVACSDADGSRTPSPSAPIARGGMTGPRASASPAYTSTPTPRPSRTLAPTAIPTETATPTVTPTPTATALPVSLDGNPRALAVKEPVPARGAPCGIVDILDFPLEPPDADTISRGGQDFNRFRERYDGYHAGEDWWGRSRRSTFGMPVYSIGHGEVTYAYGLGWGIDKGVVIVRHVLPDGSSFLSFYGHLDPPSVELRPGDCVERGDKVGEIGRPSTSPHLHFEIRTHTPAEPGPGYWGVDPRLAGWLPPSQTIWEQRAAVSPGTQWVRSFVAPGAVGVGPDATGSLLLVEKHSLLALDPLDGRERWDLSLLDPADEDEEDAPPIVAVQMDAVQPLLYVVDRGGRLAAYRLADAPTDEDGEAPLAAELAWSLPFYNLRGLGNLLPLPGGGVALQMEQRLVGLTPAGRLLWRHDFPSPPTEWLLLADELLVTTRGSGPGLWSLTADGPVAWEASLDGQLTLSGDQPFLYDGDGVYRLQPASRTTQLVLALPGGLISEGDMGPLPDGGLLLAHMDAGGRRLLALDSDGSIHWERAYAGLLEGQPRLFLHEGAPYLLLEERDSGWSKLSLYAISPEAAALTWIFRGGTREPAPADTWTLAGSAGQLFLNIGGGSLVALSPEQAIATICGAGPAAICRPAAIGSAAPAVP